MFTAGYFVGDYGPTIEDGCRKQAIVDEESCLFEVLDTAGAEEFSALRDQWIRDCEAFLIVYSINSRSSLGECESFINQVKRVKDRDYLPMVLMGNKVDLEEDRQVSRDEGIEFAKLHGCAFLECSAKTRVNVDEGFFEAVRLARGARVGYVNLPKIVINEIIVPLLCANRFSAKSGVSEIDVNVWRLILKEVYSSRHNGDVWKALIEQQRKKQLAPEKQKKCVIQ
jgi:GTPase KRas protein